MDGELRKILDRQTGTDQRLSSLSKEVGQVLDRAISKTREVESEVREHTLREAILDIIDQTKSPDGLEAQDLVGRLEDHLGVPFRTVTDELEKLHDEHILKYSTPRLGPYTQIKRTPSA